MLMDLTQTFEKMNPNIWITVTIVVILIILILFSPKIFRAIIKALAPKSGAPITGNETIDNLIAIAGYSYDPKQDIFYSSMDTWQRNMGYCRLYDESAAPMGMIIDCEPIYFTYSGKRWLIEFWKGQYDLTTGGEVGIYTAKESDINIPNVFKGTFYKCASDEDRLLMSYTLKKNRKVLLTRQDTHWWLTGFKLGEFAHPSELSLYIKITFENSTMRDAFITGLKEAGYSRKDFTITGNRVAISFNKPKTEQPSTRTPETDKIIQNKNELLCKEYQRITKDYDNFPDKLKAVQEQSPELYKHVLRLGKSADLFNIFNNIKNYLD